MFKSDEEVKAEGKLSEADLLQQGKLHSIPQMWEWRDKPGAWKRTKLAKARNQEQCELCGRGVREGLGWMVHVAGGGSVIVETSVQNEDMDSEYHSGEMGWFLLGPECGRTVPKSFRMKNVQGGWAL